MSETPKLVGKVVAGFPSPAEQLDGQSLSLDNLLVTHPAATFFVKVIGDSMIDAGILPDDILVVDRAYPLKDGDIIIASVDGEFTVKRYKKDRQGIALEPANKAYPVIRFAPGTELDYFGKVTAAIHRF